MEPTNFQQRLMPVPDTYSPKTFNATIDFDDKEINVQRRSFNIRTFNDLRRGSDELWERLRPVNEFLQTLDLDEYKYFVMLYVQAKRALTHITCRADLMNAIQAVDEIVAKTFKRLNLSERIFTYTRDVSGVVIPDLSEAGTRSQDTPEMTFLQVDYEQINAIIVVAKLLFPIFGEVIYKVQFTEDADNDVKEILAFGVMNTVLGRDFHPIVTKLKNYIKTLIANSMIDDSMLAYSGLTEVGLTHDRLARHIVKSGVNFNLFEPTGNIMRYLTVTIKKSIKTETGGSKVSYKPRHAPEDLGDDNNKTSLMENEAHVLRETLETPIIAKLSVERFIRDYLEVNRIDMGLYEETVGFYRTRTVPPTPVNELIAAAFIAGPVGAAYTLRYIDMQTMIQVLVLTQIYAAKMGFGQIIPLLTMSPTMLPKKDMDEVDNYIVINDGRGEGVGLTNYFLSLKESLLHLDDFKYCDFDEYILGDPKRNVEGVLQFIVKYVHNYNVAPRIEQIADLGPSVEHDGVVRYGKNVISELCRFLYHLLITQSRRLDDVPPTQ